MTPGGSHWPASLAEVTVPDVSRTLKSFATIRSISGTIAATSPTLAPWIQTSGPSGRGTRVSPRRSDSRAGSSLPRLRRFDSTNPASGDPANVASR